MAEATVKWYKLSHSDCFKAICQDDLFGYLRIAMSMGIIDIYVEMSTKFPWFKKRCANVRDRICSNLTTGDASSQKLSLFSISKWV